MPLLQTALTTAPGLPGAGEREYPISFESAASEWASAVGAFAAGVFPPSTTVAAAKTTLQGALLVAFQAPPDLVVDQLEDAFLAFALSVGAGMAPTYLAVAPPGPVGFAELFAAFPRPSTRAQGVAIMAAKIDAWMRTGTASLVAPPYTVVNWS